MCDRHFHQIHELEKKDQVKAKFTRLKRRIFDRLKILTTHFVHTERFQGVNSKLRQQDGRKKRTEKRSCMTDVTELLACFVVIDLHLFQCFLVFYKKICLKECKVWRKDFSNKIVTLATQVLPSSFFFRPVA